jgi:hypothetical protein
MVGMRECGIDVEGCRYIAEGIASNSTLGELDITRNQIDITGVKFLLDAVLGNYSLMKIEWSDNPFVDDEESATVTGMLADFLERNNYYLHNILMRDMAALVTDTALL